MTLTKHTELSHWKQEWIEKELNGHIVPDSQILNDIKDKLGVPKNVNPHFSLSNYKEHDHSPSDVYPRSFSVNGIPPMSPI